MTTLSNNTSPMNPDTQTIHYVSPNIQNRITISNSRNNDTNNQDRPNNTPIRRKLRPRYNIINYTQ